MRLRLSNVIGLTFLNAYLLLYCSAHLLIHMAYVFLYYFPKLFINCAIKIINKPYPGYSICEQLYCLTYLCFRDTWKGYIRIIRKMYRLIRRKNADYRRYYCRNIDNYIFE